jgi:hypothetical protein
MKTGRYLNAQALEGQSASEVPVTDVPASSETTLAAEIWLIPISLLTIAWIVIFVKQSLLLKVLHARISSKKPFQPIPCMNCRFYNSSPYLQCAVHPYRALKVEAANCPDYWSKQSNRFSH